MKGLRKQGFLAAIGCAELGHLSSLGAAGGRSRRCARLSVYFFAVAFAALTAYVTLSLPSAGGGGGFGGGVSWYGGMYDSTAPYRAKISTFFSSIFPTNLPNPSPDLSRRAIGGEVSGSSARGDEVSRDGDGRQEGSEAQSSDSAATRSSKQLGSGGGAPSGNVGVVSAPPAFNGTSTGKNGAAAAANNSPTNVSVPNSAADRNKRNAGRNSSGLAGGGDGFVTSSSVGHTVAKDGEESVDISNKHSGDVTPTNLGSRVKDDIDDAVSNSSAGVADSNIGFGNQAVNGSAAPSSGHNSGNITRAKVDGKYAIGATSNVSSGSVTVAKANFVNGKTDALLGIGSGDVTQKSCKPEDDGVETNKSSRDVISPRDQAGCPVIEGKKEDDSSSKNQTLVTSWIVKNQYQTGGSDGKVNKETTPQGSAGSSKDHSEQTIASKTENDNEVVMKGNRSATKHTGVASGNKKVDWIKEMAGCDMFHGSWVQDNSYPLYPGGSCPHIDEPFDCNLNGRPDRAYQKLRWQPSRCNIPRLDAINMLERLRGKRLVFVGDSLNRNMWESLVCILWHSVKDKSKVFEVSGRREFKTEGSYSFLFMDYNCSVEFFRSPFLVQEWETRLSNGSKKETLRLDLVEQSAPKYKDANFLIFNTGHWWTHEKTALGKDYYQEGDHIYSELNVVDAFHKALVTWSKWIDANVNPKKTVVLFRGYSASHFSGGQWNSGGSCDKETERIKNEQYLSTYPPKMSILEDVIHNMRTPVVYLNVTLLTDYRKDGHPSIYGKQNLTEEERRSPERYQDCSHWCLPGVPDSWNELVFAQLLIKQHQMLQQ